MVKRSLLKHLALLSLYFLAFVLDAHADKRVALVIGNSAYQNTAALVNPVNDAQDLATSLTYVGFTVMLERNLDKRGMENAIARFAREAQDADAAMFFFAGHGMQYRGQNYLMPVDAKLEDEFNINFELTRMDDVLFVLERTRGVKILVLDACRNNPLAERLMRASQTRDLIMTRGLARIDPARGMIVAYSTQQNQVAVDGEGRNSPFTTSLIKQINEPGVEVGTLFRRVAADVSRATAGRQLPELSVSLIGDFYLNTRATDVQAWSKIRDSTDLTELTDFISQYSMSLLVADARQRIAAIEREQAERERLEKERLAREQTERERVAREQVERLARIEVARIAQEQATRESAQREAVRAEVERARIGSEQAVRQAPPVAPPANVQTAVLTPLTEPPPTQTPLPPLLVGSALVLEIKKELKRVGCYSGRVDDKWATSATKSSVDKFVKFARLPSAPNEPALDFLDAIRGNAGRVCPLDCGAREDERNGRCVAKSCASGFVRGDDGTCEKPKENLKAAARPRESLQTANTSPPKSQPTGEKIKVFSQDPPLGVNAIRYGEKAYVNDGKCPKGQIKEIIGGDRRLGINRQQRCVTRN